MPSPKPSAPKARKPRPLKDAAPLAVPAADREVTAKDNEPPPPEAEALALMSTAVDDLYLEAQNWADGEPVSNEGQAEAVTALKSRLEEAVKTIEAERKKLTDPLYQEQKRIIAAFKPVSEKADRAIRALRNTLTNWLRALEAEQARIAEEKRKAAQQAEEELREAHRQQQTSGDLIDGERAAELEEQAERTRKDAREAERETAMVRTGSGKATLRTYWMVNITDAKELLQHFMRHDPDWLKGLLQERAERDVRSMDGDKRSLPGCNVWSEKRAI